MKKFLTLLLITVMLFGAVGCFNNKEKKEEEKPKTEEKTDAQKFAEEYKQVDEDNVFVYRDVDDIIKIMEHGTGIVYLGYPECPWCQAYVKYLNEVAKEDDVEKIYYCNTKKVKENSMEKYQKLVSLLSGHLQYNDEGNEWIYVPNVSFHINGKLIANDYESSKDTHNLKDPKDYWTEEEVKDLKSRLKSYIEEVDEALNACSDCNK